MRRVMIPAVLAILGVGLSGCVDDYGYGGVAVGYGYPGGYAYPGNGYYDAGYPGYGYDDYQDSAYGSPYWGWNDGFYYPGSGIYVYDQYRRPYRWNGSQQHYWQGRLSGWHGQRGGTVWRGFDRRGSYVSTQNRPDRPGAPSQSGYGNRAAAAGFDGMLGGRQQGFTTAREGGNIGLQNRGQAPFRSLQGTRQQAFQGGRPSGTQAVRGGRASMPPTNGRSNGIGHDTQRRGGR